MIVGAYDPTLRLTFAVAVLSAVDRIFTTLPSNHEHATRPCSRETAVRKLPRGSFVASCFEYKMHDGLWARFARIVPRQYMPILLNVIHICTDVYQLSIETTRFDPIFV
jgi:hypothetical protein